MKTVRFAVLAVLLPLAAFAQGRNWCPNIKGAKVQLAQSRASLERAPAIYKGHRAKALELIRQAEAEVQAASDVNHCR